MAATNPSYYQSGVCQDTRQKEHHFHLYMNQQPDEGSDHSNQKTIVNPGLPQAFGTTIVSDWTIRDGPVATANLVAHARGMLLGDGKADENWLFSLSILFTDTRFKGSSLKVLGDFQTEKDTEWAIVGGTGEFAFAQGIVTAKIFQSYTPSTGRTWELQIQAFCLCISGMTQTKMGPWGGNEGTTVDIPDQPMSLQTLTIGHGEVINSIAFCYTDQAGQKKIAGPWGGCDGALTKTITLAPCEIIKQVFGTIGIVGGDTVVTSLTLVSNVTIYGPFGKADGTPFCSHVPECKTVAGFYARVGASSVHALGVYCA